MTKSELQLAWKKVTREIHKRSKLGERLRSEEVSLLGDLLLYVQVLLDKIEADENNFFNSMIYKKTMNFYCAQMKEYV